MTYAERVAELEQQGMTTSDAQSIADLEQMRGRIFDRDHAAPLDTLTPIGGSTRWTNPKP